MDTPIIAAKEPAVVTLEPGAYHWCQCVTQRRNRFATDLMRALSSARSSLR